MEHNIMNEASRREFQNPGTGAAGTRTSRRRLAEEVRWVESLLQLCGREMHPFHLRRWVEKYEDDWRRLQRSAAHPSPHEPA